MAGISDKVNSSLLHWRHARQQRARPLAPHLLVVVAVPHVAVGHVRLPVGAADGGPRVGEGARALLAGWKKLFF